MQFDEIASLRKTSAAWRLLRADNAPLIVSFLGRVFVDDNVREITETDLLAQLDDELYALNERLGEGSYPKAPKAYLDDWASPDAGWLRKYYVPDVDEPCYDATPAVERAVSWIAALRDRTFVGTESRLNTVFELLRQIVYGTETDPELRLAELHRRRAEIDAEIAAVQAGDFALLDDTARRDRYQQFADVSRALLSDFREVEVNFRALDREMRERIATWSGTKGELLDEIVGNRNHISDSDQGRSFQGFYDLLLSADRLDELTMLITSVQSADDVTTIDPRLSHIHHDWLDAGGRAQATVRQLSEQLRRFLDDQVWLENRRVMDLLRRIESSAIAVRDTKTGDFTHEIDALAPTVVLPLERPLYRKPATSTVDSSGVEAGRSDGASDALYEQVHVDPTPLIAHVRKSLRQHAEITLTDVVDAAPLQQGLAELITYFSLSDDAFVKLFDEQTTDAVSWTDDGGIRRTASFPRVIFTRSTIGDRR